MTPCITSQTVARSDSQKWHKSGTTQKRGSKSRFAIAFNLLILWEFLVAISGLEPELFALRGRPKPCAFMYLHRHTQLYGASIGMNKHVIGPELDPTIPIATYFSDSQRRDRQHLQYGLNGGSSERFDGRDD